MAAKILNDYAGKEVTMLVVMTGAFTFYKDLYQAMMDQIMALNSPEKKVEVRTLFTKISTYVNDKSTKVPSINLKADDFKDKNILVVEDIFDTGNTLTALKSELVKMETKSVEFALLFVKRDVPN
eukprot:CAMPEP_0170542406 /NCGR_PEP_ID=MMETSP0211-20121228/1842_1 /TAXON_ID=311385 /ORGANISM="Pseudokeronopsis sp., Strain OXSARD2" /LENGTH=124 /DNA_ID=CAMNT_0010845453 /DNA_START=132 /DNA_END=506 /DNA_ORIENTATION=-